MNRTTAMLVTSFVPLLFGCSKPASRIDKEPAAQTQATPATEQRAGGAVRTEVVQADVVAPSKIDAVPEIHDVAPVTQPLAKAPAPTSKDWDSSEPMEVSNKQCEAKRLGDYVRVKCTDTTGGIEELAGDARGVTFGCWNASSEASCVVFPVRPGDKRIFQFSDMFFSGGWGGGATKFQKAMVSVWWPKKAAEPKITID